MAKAMRFRCIHSFMVLTVVGLLLVYSAFLTTPTSIIDENSVDGENGGSNSLKLLNGSSISIFSETVVVPQSQSQVQQIQFVAQEPKQENLSPSLPQTASSPYILPYDLQGVSPDGEFGTLLSSSSSLSGRSRSPEVVDQQQQQVDLINPTLVQQQQQNIDPSVQQQQQQHMPSTSITTKLVKKATVPLPQSPLQQHHPGGPYSKNAIFTRDIYEPGFFYGNPQLCPADGIDIRLIILITSAPSHFSAREAIRLTWGHYAHRVDIALAFFLGRVENETILERIELEKHLYDDLIIANFVDSYDNLTLKTMSSMEWIDNFCNQSDFVLKTDDDMFINVPNLLNFIDKIEDGDRKEAKFYGRLARKWKPVRNKKSKYYISFQQFRKTVYPDFVTGPAYLFSSRIARPIFEKGMTKTYLKLEDVYTTGILAQELGIRRMNIGDFANKKVNFHKTGFCALTKLISMHMVAYAEQFELWKKILDQRTKCKIIYSSAKSKELSQSSPSSTNLTPNKTNTSSPNR